MTVQQAIAAPSFEKGKSAKCEYSYEAIQSALQDFFAKLDLDPSSAALFNASSAETRAEALTTLICGAPTPETPPSPVKPLGHTRRVLLTGCFDLMHAGHYNALRQAKMCFPGEEIVLVAGVHGDEAIQAAKGAPTVCTNEERVEMVRACRWVDEVVGDLPYAVPIKLLDDLRCDMAVHGDDLPRSADGNGLFDELMAADRLKIVKRTEGTSTTGIIGRLLSMSKEHLQKSEDLKHNKIALVSDECSRDPIICPSGRLRRGGCRESDDNALVPSKSSSSYKSQLPNWILLPTMSRMSVFYSGRANKLALAKKVVYAPGAWDLFHNGHVNFLKKASEIGDFLLVGCYQDVNIHQRKGQNYPLQTVHERALNVLACKYVDDVLLDAPWSITQDLLTTLNVAVVVLGGNKSDIEGMLDQDDYLQQVRSSGKLQFQESTCSMTMDTIVERIMERTIAYTIRQQKKEEVERTYSDNKSFVAEA